MAIGYRGDDMEIDYKRMLEMIREHIEGNKVGEITISFNEYADKLDIITTSRMRMEDLKRNGKYNNG